MNNAPSIGNFFLALILIFFLFQGKAHAADYTLFVSKGVSIPWREYDAIIKKLKEGDTITFSNKKKFTVQQILGRGQNVIIDIGNQRVQRIIRSMNPSRRGSGGPLSIAKYVRGYELLAKKRFHIPRIDLEKSYLPEYVIEQKVDFDFLLEDYLEGRVSLSPKAEKKLIERLLAFAKRTALFRIIGDFHEGQLAWSNDDWILLDWSNEHEYARFILDRNTFEQCHACELPEELAKKIKRVIVIERILRWPQLACIHLLGKFNR